MLLIAIIDSVNGQDVIRASGGTGLSIDNVDGDYTLLDGPTIRETSVNELTAGDKVILTLPTGYEWNTGLSVMPEAGQGDIGSEDVTFIIVPRGAQNTDLKVSFDDLTAQTFEFTIEAGSQSAGQGKGPARITIDGLELRPTDTNVPDSDSITNTGTTAPDVNYGNLSKAPGSISEVRIETAADGTGSVYPSSTLLAGNDATVYAIARDVGGNFINNVALDDESDWILTEVNGGIPQTALEPDAGLRRATFLSTVTGSARIQANYAGATSEPSGIITVDPRSANQMIVDTQPSSSAIAGVPWDPQPVIHLLDQFGNLVTTDSTSNVSAFIESGDGTLFGTTDIPVSGGTAVFEDLFSQIANDITLRFESAGLNSVFSNTITINPADESKLQFTSVPSSGNVDVNFTPPVIVQLLDEFDNHVLKSNIDINVEIEQGTGDLNGTTSEATNNMGEAVFDEIRFNDASDNKTIQATSDELISDTSGTIEIFGEGELSAFRIESTDDTPIGTQTADESFDIKMTAIDGNGNTIGDFDEAVELSSSSAIGFGGGTTGNFEDGVLVHSMTLETSGSHTITAKYTVNNSINGTSNEFQIEPSTVDFANTEIVADPDQIIADGNSTSEIKVQLKDQFQNNLMTGGESITIETDHGTLSAGAQSGELSVTAEDNNDGTYRAQLTSSADLETATIEAIQDNETPATTTVDFVAGDVEEFLIMVPMDNGDPAIQTAGVPFKIDVEAVDGNGNRVEGYSGTLSFSSNSVISSGATATLNDGLLENHDITLTKSGVDNITISAEDSELFNVSGTSAAFTVQAAGPDVSASQVIANPDVIQNDGSSQSSIIVILRDEYNNLILEDFENDLTIDLERLELNGSPSSGTPDATVTTLSYTPGNSTYEATLTSTTTLELVEIAASYDNSALDDRPTVDIVLPNEWEPAGGPDEARNDWTRDDNWSLEREPTVDDFVIIPDGAADYPDLDLNVNIGSLDIQQGGQLVLFGGNAITVSGEVRVDGTLDIEDNTELSVGGNFSGIGSFATGSNALVNIAGDITIANLLARTTDTVVRLNGSTQQTLTTAFLLAERLEVLNDVLATSGDVIDTSELLITEGNTFELAQGAGITVDNIVDILGQGTFILNDNTLVVRGDISLVNIDTSEGTVVFGIREGEDFGDYPGLGRQQIANLSEMKNAVVNNPFGVRTFEDIVLDGTLELRCGPLIISSGKSLIAPDIQYDTNDPSENCSEPGELQFRRLISSTPGWRMMSSPVGTTYQNLFDGLTIQGVADSDFEDDPDGDRYQPNLFWFDEGESDGTTYQQRWKIPGSVTETIHPGRGHFFFVFDDRDTEVGNTLPHTITASGQEHTGSPFDFGVTYTAATGQDNTDPYVAQDTVGWNLIGNPFGASINWTDANNGTNWTKDNLDDVVYIWQTKDLGAGRISGEYKVYNGITGSDFGSLDSGLIPPFQAFWVKANDDNPVLQVQEEAKTTGGQFQQKSQSNSDHQVVLRLEAGDLTTSTYFSFSKNGKPGLDEGDAYLLEPMADTYLDFYSLALDHHRDFQIPLVINNLPETSVSEFEIPLGVRGYDQGQPVRGAYQVTLDSKTSIPDHWELHLVDNVTGGTVNLNNSTARRNPEMVTYSTEIDHFKGIQEYFEIPSLQMGENPAPPLANIREHEDGAASDKNDPAQKSSTDSMEETASYANTDFPFTLIVRPDPLSDGDLPDRIFLRQNYPNPFNPATTIRFGLPEEQRVRLEVFDVLGRKVQTLIDETLRGGVHSTRFDAAQFASGIYIYRLHTGDQVITRKMTFIK